MKGKTVYPEKRGFVTTTYWTVPEEERPVELPEPWVSNSIEARQAYNAAYSQAQIYSREIERDDPDLVRVVEELGKGANGDFAMLKVVDVPDGVEWEIDEYDGRERVAERHRTWG